MLSSVLLPIDNTPVGQHPCIIRLLKGVFFRERSGSVVECLTQDRRAVGSSLTGVTALCP